MASKHPSLEELYEKHAAQVRTLLHRYGAENDIDDLVQETFLKIWKALPEFKGDSSVTTWIYRITINTAKNSRRAKKRKWWLLLHREDEGPEIESPAPSIAETLEAKGALDEALKSLSPKLRETLSLYSLKELEIEEIATILEISPGTVKSRLHTARTLLERYFKDEEESA